MNSLMGPGTIADIAAFEPIARSRAPVNGWSYVAGGADSEFTMRRNVQAFSWIDLVGGHAIPDDAVDLSTALWGTPMSVPFLVSPTSGHRILHPDGPREMYRGAAAARVPMVLSALAGDASDVARVADGTLFFQIYNEHPAATEARIKEAADSGCRGLFITVDSPYHPHEERMLLAASASTQSTLGLKAARAAVRHMLGREAPVVTLVPPYRLQARNPSFTWTQLEQIKRRAQVPVIVKGIFTAEDARLAVEHGMDGLVVSNHGGRCQDHTCSTMEVLEEIVDVGRGRLPVLVDSGIRHCDDILKALALGANAVLVGRPTLWGLGAFGAPGVTQVLELLRHQLAKAMARSGLRTVREIHRGAVRTEFP